MPWCQFVHHKVHMTGPGIEPGLHCYGDGDSLRYGLVPTVGPVLCLKLQKTIRKPDLLPSSGEQSKRRLFS
jgi:hypothetical protein